MEGKMLEFMSNYPQDTWINIVDDLLGILPIPGTTLMHYACYGNNYEIIKILYNMGIDVNAENAELVTPIQLACRNFKKELLAALIECGANVRDTLTYILDEWGKIGCTECATLLIVAGARTTDPGPVILHLGLYKLEREILQGLQSCRSVAIAFMAVKRTNDGKILLTHWDRFVLRYIAKLVWQTKMSWITITE
jgi:hypothetical protein